MPARKNITWKPKPGTTWRDKLVREHPKHGAIVKPSPSQKKAGISGMLIPRPIDVDRAVRTVRKGKLITMEGLRDRLARQAGADAACPLTTGIFLRIVAEAAEVDRRAGKKRLAPYWRVVRNNGGLNEKYPGGTTGQARQLRAEGFTILRARGKQPPKVRDFEKRLVPPVVERDVPTH